MSLFQSFFILQGCDNRLRFLFILLAAIACHGVGWLLSHNIVFQLIINVLLSYMVFASNVRRITDCKLSQANYFLLLAPSILFVVTSLSASWLSATMLSVLWFITLLSALFPLRFHEQYQHYIYGYVGKKPIKHDKPHHQKMRVEPVIASTEASDILQFDNAPMPITEQMQASSTSPDQASNTQFSLNTDQWLLFIKNNQGYVIAGFSLLMLIFAFGIWFTLSGTQHEPEANTIAPPEITKPRLTLETFNQVHFDDGFSLASTQFNGLVLIWQTQQTAAQAQLLWDKLTEQNDDSCQRIGFNKGKAIELQRVVQMPSGEIQAYFSPLDSQQLIQSLAFRGYFKLCGYKFSLKGSQATLAQHLYYGDLITY